MAKLSPSSPSPSPAKKPQPLPWTHDETIHLIRAYQEKWYSQKRGPLKASQWEEVAVTVIVRCGYDHSNPSAKSAIQCRHKMEKLRKRYRNEKVRDGGTKWQYFGLMDSLTRGPFPISARPVDGYRVPCQSSYNYNGKIKEENVVLDEPDGRNHPNDNNVCNDDGGGGSGGGGVMNSQSLDYVIGNTATVKRRKIEVDEEVSVRLAAEIREFAANFVGIGKRKIDMMRESERWREEMENKRIQLIVDSHTKIVDFINSAFGKQNENQN